MAKTRAQRKAEKRAREAEEQKRSGPGGSRKSDSRAQHDTQVPVSGDIAEIEAVEAGIAAGAPEGSLETPDARKSNRAEKRAEAKATKEAEKRRKGEQKRRESEQLAKKQKQAQADRQRGGVLGFLASCWAELKRVQWPDRETLVQASAVTVIFVAVAAIYLGALDSAFSFLLDHLL
jgi:preprotein translocase SecE subunit